MEKIPTRASPSGQQTYGKTPSPLIRTMQIKTPFLTYQFSKHFKGSEKWIVSYD